MTRTLSVGEARRFYDRFGAKQDKQGFYEDRALDALVAHAGFGEARALVELGCGTGRFAERLLRDALPATATYVGFDVSATMIGLAQARLAGYADRARVVQSDGSPPLPVDAGSCDRFVSTYVLDLLAEADIRRWLDEARRVLAPGGLVCLAGLTPGPTALTRVVSSLWSAIHAVSPRVVGGCRPLRLDALLGDRWRIVHREVVSSWGIATEVLVAA